MNTAPAGLFAPNINTMDASSRLPHFPKDFIGTVRVSVCKGITPRTGAARAFIAELEIVTSNMPEDVRVGGKYSWYQSLQEAGTAYPACIAFLYACLGLDSVRDKVKIATTIKPKQDKYLNDAVSDANPLGGTLVNLQTLNKKTKKNTDFTVHSFSPHIAAA